MKQPFLESLACHLIRSGLSAAGDVQIILPNRRAGLFLQRHLASHSTEVKWLPRICSIGDYIDEISQLRLSDPIEQLFALYDVYCTLVELAEPFDEFYYWGEMMLKDFDELDKYLVDARMLFSNIIDLKELEEPLAGLEENQVNFIRQFWEGFHQGERTREKEQFVTQWERLPLLYNGLREKLLAREEGYQGMQYREIAERISEGGLEPTFRGRTIVAGFNALNGCEKRIFQWLNKHEAEFYWDYDHLYTDDDSSEAGRFLRDNMQQFPQHIELETFRGLEDKKQIRIFELPTNVLQAKTVHRILEQEAFRATGDCTDTALVLCDEELLIPVIMSLPESIEELNVTMGYPMKNTPVFGFVDSLIRMQHSIRTGSDGMEQFYHKDVTSILLHPYMRGAEGATGELLLKEMARTNMVTVEGNRFTGAREMKVFRKVQGADDLIVYLRGIFQDVLQYLSEVNEKLHQELDREFIFRFLIQLNKLESILEARPEITTAILERLLQKMMSLLRVPFEGEPLAGLQVMGILETRLLDFKHVILLSMNEDVMPASHSGHTYLPYAIRIAFGMPAREDMDAIYAYYFYRLLQRAEKIDLLYNSGSEGIRNGEKSRYLYQLIFSHGIEVIRPGMEVLARETPPVFIEHNQEIEALLERYILEGEDQKYLSPSAINTYIDCSLKFYLRYLAGIGEPDEVKEEIDPAGFGTVVHETIRVLYQEIAERNEHVITVGELEELTSSSRPEEALRNVFLDTHFKGRKQAAIEGRNIIIFRVMLRYLQKIIQTDLHLAPFDLVSVEQTYQRVLVIRSGMASRVIRMGGKIDRIDRVGNRLRVIDYKTGEARVGFPSVEKLFDSSLSTRNGAALQTLFYAWLVSSAFPGEEVLPGIYGLKALYDVDFDPALTMGHYSQRQRIESFTLVEEPYIRLLQEVLVDLFDPQVPFVQTENESKCRTCDFASICNRTLIE